jgi:hypothetical protein
MKWGERQTVWNNRYYYGKMPLLDALFYWSVGKKIVRWWVGTDSDTLITTPPGAWHWRKVRLPLHRLKTTLTEFMIHKHLYGCHHVKENLLRFGIPETKLRRRSYELLYPKAVDKTLPVILLHLPKIKRNRQYKEYYYGFDVARELMQSEPAHYFIADNGQKMEPYFAVADMCILTKRAIGEPRLQRECQLNGIPVYYNPQNPNVADIVKFIHQNKSDKR